MATNAGNNPNAQKSTVKGVKEFVYDWEGKDRKGKQVRGEMRAAGENIVQTTLRRQGVIPNKIKKRPGVRPSNNFFIRLGIDLI